MSALHASNVHDAALLSRIEDAGLNASAPPQQRWLDGWLLRFSPGKAKRARCINAVAPGRQPPERKLELAREAYAQAGLPLIVRITPFAQPEGLDALLASTGMHMLDDTRVMVRPGLDGLGEAGLPRGTSMHRVAHEPFAHAVGGLRGSALAQRQAHAQRLENELAGLYDVFTAPEARGQGLAQALCRSLLALARQRGARVGYLQVEGDNDPARSAYRRLGFADAYAYHYRTADPAAR
jgi:ribosomal protein S18 acetylase RimI-like enzyme